MSRQPYHRLGLEPLEPRDVPAFLPGSAIVAAGDTGGPPVVRLLDPDSGAVRSQFLAYEATFTGGVRVAVGDVNADGVPDLITGTGAGGGPAVKVYDGATGGVLASFFAYAPSFTGGVTVAAGDVDGDGRAEVIVGAGAGGGPQVVVFDGVTGSQEASFFAYDSGFRGGVFVAAGDTDGDGLAEVVTGTGVGGGPDVRTFDLARGQAVQATGFFAYAPTFTGGVQVAAGDVTGDGIAEIISGTGPGGGPQVAVFTPAGRQVMSFFAYDEDFRNGVNVGAADLTGDGTAEILTGAGPGGGAQVNVFAFGDDDPTQSLTGLPRSVAGVLVAGSPLPLALPSVSDGVIEDAYDQAAAVIAAQVAAAQAAFAAAQPQTILVPFPVPVGVNNRFGGSPFFGPGFGPGFGFGGFGPGFGGPFVGDPFFGGPFAGDPFFGGPFVGDPFLGDPFFGPGVDGGFPCFTCEGSAFFDPAFTDPGFFGPGFIDPGFGGEGFVDPGFGGEGFVDPGFGGEGFVDPGFGGEGFVDPGFGGFGGEGF